MAETGEEAPIFGEISAASRDLEIATYKGDTTVIEEADNRLKKVVFDAATFGIKQTAISRAEVQGRIIAASEQGENKALRFYEKSLESIEE